MGWASASNIFNRVAHALVDLNADADTKRKVLGPLIDELRDGDWDTCDESMDEFRDDPVVVELFVQKLGTELDGNTGYGSIDWVADSFWQLDCDEHGQLDTADGDAEGHDRLVRAWAEHDREHHGGDGVADMSMLIVQPGEVTR